MMNQTEFVTNVCKKLGVDRMAHVTSAIHTLQKATRCLSRLQDMTGAAADWDVENKVDELIEDRKKLKNLEDATEFKRRISSLFGTSNLDTITARVTGSSKRPITDFELRFNEVKHTLGVFRAGDVIPRIDEIKQENALLHSIIDGTHEAYTQIERALGDGQHMDPEDMGKRVQALKTDRALSWRSIADLCRLLGVDYPEANFPQAVENAAQAVREMSDRAGQLCTMLGVVKDDYIGAALVLEKLLNVKKEGE